MEETLHIPVGKTTLEANLFLPKASLPPKGLIVFVHGSGSSRFSPRNVYVARVLQQAGFVTFLGDLLSKEEEQIYDLRFDIPLLTARVEAMIDWIKNEKAIKDLPMGLFGASTGAAAALMAAAHKQDIVKAVVSRGGRPDLALDILPQVKAPSLFIVGELDFVVIELNKKAFDELIGIKEIKVIPGATHLFEESGCLEQVALLATQWFSTHLV